MDNDLGLNLYDDERYLSEQLITYIGNKRSLLGPIAKAVEQVKQRLNKRKLRIFEPFSGSGVVSRYFKAHASRLIVNDIEDYATLLSRCFLRNYSTVDMEMLANHVEFLNGNVYLPSTLGFIEEMYAPKDEANITKSDRVFYTIDNARRLDNYRRMIDVVGQSNYEDLLIGPLLSKASVHCNTSGVFKGFYKNKETGIGQYGGTGEDALERIKGMIEVEVPVLSRFECDYTVFQGDANKVASDAGLVDLAYIDPPYNQHSYSSNYFMLNLLTNYRPPNRISRISGIPEGWKRSGYNVKRKSKRLLKDLLDKIDCYYYLISFNNEGFIRPDEMREMLSDIGTVTAYETPYNAFRGSRNLNDRNPYVIEQLFLVERK